MPTLAQLPKMVPLSSTGTLLAGSKCYFYETGTSTPKNTYTDFALSVAHANPVVADAYGVFAPIYLQNDARYRLTLKTSADVLIYTVDDVGGPLMTQAEVGSVLYPRTAEEITAGVTPTNYFYPPLDIRRYGGAVAASAGTNATAIANGMAVLAVAVGGELLFPESGTYQTSGTYSFSESVSWRGAGMLATIVKYTGSSDFVTFPSTSGRNGLHNLTLEGTSQGGTGLRIGDTNHSGDHYCTNTRIYGFNTGVRLSAALWTVFQKCRIDGNNYGVDYNAGSGSMYSNAIEFFGCIIMNNDRNGIAASSTPVRNVGLKYIGGSIESNSSEDPATYPQIVLGSTAHFYFNTYIESSAGTKPDGFNLTNASNGEIADTYFNGTDTAIKASSAACNAIFIHNCRFVSTSTRPINLPSCPQVLALHNEYDLSNSVIDESTSINLTGRVAQGVHGSYTGTLTGCTTSPTGSVEYTLVDDVVTLHIPAITGTSNTAAATITGMPSAIYPSASRGAVGVTTDNGANVLAQLVIGTGGTITLYVGTSTTFTGSGTKGIAASSLSYKI